MRFCATLWIATGACALRATRRGAIDFAKNSAAAAATAGVAVAAPRRAAAAVAGAIVSDEVAVTFQEASVGLQLEAIGFAKATLGSMPSFRVAVTLVVERLNSPVVCGRGAERGDLLEIRYEGRLAADGRLFDGSAITFAGGNQVAGRGGDSTVYFVLGQQPLGQFPAAWDRAGGACAPARPAPRRPPPGVDDDAMMQQDDIPVFDANVYKRQYYDQFLSALEAAPNA
ncbi:peptidyl-prolyl cis-trans isomerase [Aureococcus anophagefferens]|uniref:Peptidyl-prolyl cis-trans isomerase n=1 Tax=Aureococcus anophagefferens TaxID=44056 RepID=A0ABR1G4V7_AURAN